MLKIELHCNWLPVNFMKIQKKICIEHDCFWKDAYRKTIIKRCVQNPVKHLKSSILQKQRLLIVSYCRKTLYFRRLTGF